MEDEKIIDYFKTKIKNESNVDNLDKVKKIKSEQIEMKKGRKEIRKNKELLELIKDLYLLDFNTKALTSYEDEFGNVGYRTMKILGKDGKVKFNVSEALVRHLNGESILGVFANEVPEYSKFICFDIDSTEITFLYTLMETLITDFKVKKENLLISYSGNKGYHLDLFFKKDTENRYPNTINIQIFYLNAMQKVQEKLLENKNVELENEITKIIEYRPTSKQGCKLPLGVHFKTGNYCNIYNLDNKLNLEPINKKEVVENLKNIEKLNFEELLKHCKDKRLDLFKIKTKIEKDFRSLKFKNNLKILENSQSSLENTARCETVSKNKHLVAREVANSDCIEIEKENVVSFYQGNQRDYTVLSDMCQEVLDVGKIVVKGTRHQVMFELIKHFKSTEVPESEYVEILENIIKKSSVTMDTAVDEALIKLHNLIPYVKPSNSFYKNLESSPLSKQDIDTLIILKKQFKLSSPEISLLILFMRVSKITKDETLKISYSLIKKYKEDTSNNSFIRSKLKKFHDLGLITHLNKDNKEKSIDSNGLFNIEINKFKLNFNVSISQNSYLVKGNSDFNYVVNKIYNKKIIVSTLDRKHKDKFKSEGIYKNNELNLGLDIEYVEVNGRKYYYE